MTKSSKKTNVKRTLHYFWQEAKNHKGYSLGFLILSPIVILIRNVLTVYYSADIIGKIADGISKEEIYSNLLPEVAIFLAIYIVNSVVLEKLRLYFCWKMELKSLCNLSSRCLFTTKPSVKYRLSTEVAQIRNCVAFFEFTLYPTEIIMSRL